MTPIAAVQISTDLLMSLGTTAARVLVLAAAAGIGLAAFGVKSTSLRLFTWTAVLYAALAMPLLERTLPPLPVPTPAVLQNRAVQSASNEVRLFPATSKDLNSTVAGTTTEGLAGPERPRSLASSTVQWGTVAAGIYFAIAIFFLVRLLVGLGSAAACGGRRPWLTRPG